MTKTHKDGITEELSDYLNEKRRIRALKQSIIEQQPKPTPEETKALTDAELLKRNLMYQIHEETGFNPKLPWGTNLWHKEDEDNKEK